MNAIFYRFLCDHGHDWNKLAAAGISVDPGVCPVCQDKAIRHAEVMIADHPLFRLVSSAQKHQQSGLIMGDGLFYLILQSPDLEEELCCRSPLRWDDAVRLAYDLKGLSYVKARQIFLRKADETAGIHESLRAKINTE